MPKLPKGLTTRPDRPGYYARIHRGGKDTVVKLSNDRREAINRLRSLNGAPLIENATVAQAAKLWLEQRIATARTASGQRLCAQRVRDYLAPAIGYKQVAKVTPDDCRAYRMTLEANKLAPLTVSHVLADLRGLLIYSVEAGWISRSPFPRRLLPKIQERSPDRLTDEEVEQLVALPEPWGFTMRFLIGTGLRWGEAPEPARRELPGLWLRAEGQGRARHARRGDAPDDVPAVPCRARDVG